ncbi:helix-turn-helix domain-containing protein [Hymenobacter volaticus]|uniref:AraC family transcriptional regulator n=1 Tax=Hymenobacter volaticus TaxID=2932254 RepID=A0ABY4GDT3_9BACT|nr:AraC family transcriptional regulator [Hymenobacter volaticus]UOQ68911.1 AraC family transcriptional regulator [Hymenobacter volaticus]
MSLSGNNNTLRYDTQLARPSQKHQTTSSPTGPEADVVTETQLLREQRWPELTVQLFAEPACVTPVQLGPPSQLRLLLLLSGTMRMHVHSGGRELAYTSQAGTVKLTTPNHLPYQMHWSTLTADPVRTAHLYLPLELLSRTADAAGLNSARVELAEGCAIPDPLLYQVGCALAQQANNAPESDRLFAETATQLLAAQLLRQHCVFVHELPDHRGKLTSKQVQQIRDFVQDQIGEVIRLEDLAALVFLSSYHFCRVFKRTTGLSPNQFVIRQRMERASELLRHSGLSVKQVAFAVGYTNHAHFTQLFVRHTKQLPLRLTQKRKAEERAPRNDT